MRSVCLTLLAAAGFLSAACTTPDFVKQDESDVILRITDVVGDPGGDGPSGDSLLSDVCCAIFNDNALLTFEAVPKNANLDVIDFHNDVFLERYEVVYRRSDGRNEEGVDVPYRITGAMAQVVRADSGGTGASLILVRHQAKIEPPLRNLHGVFLQGVPASGVFQFGGAGILTTIAEITIHGRQSNGKVVKAKTFLEVVFADFGGEG